MSTSSYNLTGLESVARQRQNFSAAQVTAVITWSLSNIPEHQAEVGPGGAMGPGLAALITQLEQLQQRDSD